MLAAQCWQPGVARGVSGSRPDGRPTVLPRRLRVRSHAEFTEVTRSGRKAKCGSVVVYRSCPSVNSAPPDGSVPPSRGGLIVGRSVGNAVCRHRVSRVIRSALASALPEANDELVVVRALAGAGQRSGSELRADVLSALARLRVSGDMGQDPGTTRRVSP